MVSAAQKQYTDSKVSFSVGQDDGRTCQDINGYVVRTKRYKISVLRPVISALVLTQQAFSPLEKKMGKLVKI